MIFALNSMSHNILFNKTSLYSLWFIALTTLLFTPFAFFYLGFLSRPFTNHSTAGEGGRHFFNSSLPLPPASQTRRHQPGDRCRGVTSAHRQQPHANREPLVSERKSLTTKLHALYVQDATTFILNCVLKTVLCTRKWLSYNPYKKV